MAAPVAGLGSLGRGLLRGAPMSAPLIVDKEIFLCYATKRVEKGVPPNLMACSRVIHGECSRCGKVPASHFARAKPEGVRNEEDWERERIKSVHAFFQAKRAYRPTKAQLRMYINAK